MAAARQLNIARGGGRRRDQAVEPDLGSAVVELRERMANIVVDNIIAVLAGRFPPNCANPEVLEG